MSAPAGCGIDRCSFCNRPKHEVAAMIAGPGRVGSPERKLICNVCVEEARGLLAAPKGAMAVAPEGVGHLVEIRDGDHACSFCCRRLPGVKHLLAGANAACICQACVALCAEISAETCAARRAVRS